MKILVKTLELTHFEIEVKPEHTVADVKKTIECTQGADVCPAVKQLLVHKGKVLADDTTLEENKVAANSFVVMLTKNKVSPAIGSATSSAPAVKATETSAPPTSATTTPQPPASAAAPEPAPAPAPYSASNDVSDVYGLAASNLVAGNNLEGTIQQILDMGGGNWDRDTVVRALRAAYNNPERAFEYLYSGIPESAESPPAPRTVPSAQAANIPAQPQAAQPALVPSIGPNTNPLDLFPAPVPSTGPNTNPLNLFPAPVPSTGPNTNPLNLFPAPVPSTGPNANPLDISSLQEFPSLGTNVGGTNTRNFPRNSPQFEASRAMVQANPQLSQRMLQELGRQNPQWLRQIQANPGELFRIINEPTEGGEGIGNVVGRTVTITPEELEAVERLEAMGFNRELALEVYFACNKNEELAANYLLDHSHEFEE